MARREVRYYPYTSKEIEVYKKETDHKKDRREDFTNLILVMLRKNYLSTIKNEMKLAKTVNKYNHFVKDQEISEIVKVIRNFLNS